MNDNTLYKYNCNDFSKVDSIGVICRGMSLGSIGKYKEHFKNTFVVGQHLQSFNLIGKHIIKSNIVRISGNTFFKPSKRYLNLYDEYNMQDLQTSLFLGSSPRKELKFKKMISTYDGIMEVYPRPLAMIGRNKRGGKKSYPTLGIFGVDLACVYKPKSVHIIGLDFYTAPYLTKECANVSWSKNQGKSEPMIEYFNLLCEEEKNIQFYLYTCCDRIKSTHNLKVIKV